MAAHAHTQAPTRLRRSYGSFVMPTLALLLVGLLLVWLIVNFAKGPSYFVTVAFIGLTNGALYALVALGYTLVYGILELINFAHGDVFMLGSLFPVDAWAFRWKTDRSMVAEKSEPSMKTSP